MKRPDISLIIPTKNEEKNLEKFLQSVKKARFDGEILVVDANSKDKTREIAKKYGCKVILEKSNFSPAHARQLGIKSSKSKIVIILDADRELTKHYFDEIKKVKDWDALIVKEIKTEDTFLEKVYSERCFKHEYSLWPSVFKKHVFNTESFDPKLGFGEDEDFFNRIKSKFEIKKCNAKIKIHTIHSLKELFRQWLWYGRSSFARFKKHKKISTFFMLTFLLLPFIFTTLPLYIRLLSLIIWIYELIVILRTKKIIGLVFPFFDFLRGVFFLLGMIQNIYKRELGR